MFIRAFGDLRAAISGNVTVIFALCTIPLFVIAALSVDTWRREVADRHVQAASDAASLAGARALSEFAMTDTELTQVVSHSFNANMQTAHQDVSCPTRTIDIDRSTVTVRISVECKVPSMIAGAITPDALRVTKTASAQAVMPDLELALMLDVSDSMVGARLAGMKKAAKDTAKRLLSISAAGKVRIAFVSYGNSVNAGVYGNQALGRPPGDDSDGDGLDKVCVAERPGIAARRDDAPGHGKWVSDLAVQRPNSSLMPLTSDLTAFNDAVDSLGPEGMTAGQIGVAWSWYLLSPKWRDIWPTTAKPADYGAADTTKVVILMTDGKFNMYYHPTLGNSRVQIYRLCRAMRDAGIIIYAVAFDAPLSAEFTLQLCVGHEDNYYEADSVDELLDAYAAIAGQLSELALRN